MLIPAVPPCELAAALILLNKCLLWLQLQGAEAPCDTLSCGELQRYRVSPLGLMWTLHTMSSSHHGYIGHRQASEDRQLSLVIVWVWQFMTMTMIALYWEFKWWQIDNAVDIDENTKQVLTYDICKAALTTDGENMAWCVLSMFVVGQVLSL